MCGMSGIIDLGQGLNLTLELMQALAFSVQMGNTDAWGCLIGVGGCNDLISHKESGIFTPRGFLDIIEKVNGRTINYIAFHARDAVYGSPQDNRNNHPVCSTRGSLHLMHEGCVDAEEIYGFLDRIWPGYSKSGREAADVDTQALAEVIEGLSSLQFGERKRELAYTVSSVLQSCGGGNTVFMVEKSKPWLLYLGTLENPDYVSIELYDRVMLWSTRPIDYGLSGFIENLGDKNLRCILGQRVHVFDLHQGVWETFNDAIAPESVIPLWAMASSTADQTK